MSLKGIATQTLGIIARGHYHNSDDVRVELAAGIERAVEGTRLYTPTELSRLLSPPASSSPLASSPPATSSSPPTTIAVCNETTQVATQRLASEHDHIVLLNYASAKSAGGGFINGAKAQEEDLARCSALYPCLLSQREYYEVNRRDGTMIYTDYVIYSPAVPFFRVHSRTLIDQPFYSAVITAPAPNAGEHLRRDSDGHADISEALRRRAGYVLAIAKDQGHRCLVLGAWGCGVFRNDPHEMAEIFATWLADPQFADAFDHVEMAVWDRSKSQANIRAFEARFASR